MFAGQDFEREGIKGPGATSDERPQEISGTLPKVASEQSLPVLDRVRLVPQADGSQRGVASFDRIGSIPAKVLGDVRAESLEVTQRDGWDNIKVKLAGSVVLNINSTFGELLDQAGSAGGLAKSLARDAYFDPEVSYRGRLLPDGRIEVRDITGVSFTTSIPFVGKVKPLSAIITPDGEVQVRARARIFTGSKSINIPPEFVTMFGDAIREFEQLRRN